MVFHIIRNVLGPYNLFSKIDSKALVVNPTHLCDSACIKALKLLVDMRKNLKLWEHLILWTLRIKKQKILH